MTLAHYSVEPVHEVRSVAIQDGPRDFKPKGFWLSVDDGEGWVDWCLAEQFRLERLLVRHIVTLAPRANILRLSSAKEVRGFSAEYGSLDRGFCNKIDWPRIAGIYQGIIIAPYQWDCRLEHDTHWYYSWDCSSGCIWDAAAIASIAVDDSFAPPQREDRAA